MITFITKLYMNSIDFHKNATAQLTRVSALRGNIIEIGRS